MIRGLRHEIRGRHARRYHGGVTLFDGSPQNKVNPTAVLVSFLQVGHKFLQRRQQLVAFGTQPFDFVSGIRQPLAALCHPSPSSI
jgi:hypothetical protein